MKRIHSGQGVTDLGSQMAAEGDDLMGRGEAAKVDVQQPTILVDKPVLQGTPDRTVTFTGHAAEEYRKIKAEGGSDEAAYVRAQAIENLMTPKATDDIAAVIQAKREEIVAKDPSLAPMFTQAEDQVLATARALGCHTCTYDDHGEDSDCWACNPYAKNRPSGVTVPEASDGPSELVDMVNHPPHYESLPGIDFECIVVTRNLTFDVGNAVKYVWRADRKNGHQDLEKARWYVQDALDHADPVYSGAREEWYLTDELLQRVSLASTGHRSMFFEAIRLGYLEIALKAVSALIDRAGD